MQDGPTFLPNNIDMSSCERCGGVRTYWVSVEMMTAEQVKAQHNELKPTLSQFRLCTCPEAYILADAQLESAALNADIAAGRAPALSIEVDAEVDGHRYKGTLYRVESE